MLQTRIKNRLIRRGIVALALLATLPGAPVAAGQTFDEAVAAYGRGDYATAVRGFLVHAEQGDASAQFNLGLMYGNGRGVLKDEAEAVRWYRLAAEQGDAGAQFNLGLMYGNGEGVLKNEAEAARWFRLAAEQGVATAQYGLGFMYDIGEGVLKDEAEAVRWYRLAAEQGHATAQSNLGFIVRQRAGRSQGQGRSCALVPAGRRAGRRYGPIRPRVHVRWSHVRCRRGRPQEGFRACAHVVQHRWRKRERKSQEVAGHS